ncbi:ECF transporter S component [Corynebacterium crudilactis]|uniref:Uncharacterized protein n=1 Tax=Corynebacterium crudilactis TaxID=1652495 RepID=A0A172QSN4_9CORY|nr:ECF transporter S component [Corynebacterium crudilactis]ANE03668.1 hypothetical protein ccrud_05200 [Corynebacterium crudilactis]
MANLAMQKNTQQSSWRVIDIVIASVLGVACGLIFIVWNSIGYAWTTAFHALTPGLGGVAIGIWLLGGVLGGLVIRKPGAALFVEVVAACVSAALASQFGISTIYSGLVQGLGAEIIFALFLYRRFNLPIAMLAGAGAAVGGIILELFFYGNLAKTLSFNIIYSTTSVISGMILAGLLSWFLVRALARTGALDRFAAGREMK